MIAKLQAKYPKISVAGFYSPPFRPLTDEEDKEIVDRINESGAQVVWVGVSTPKQEFWMRDHVRLIKGATLIGVGAAFDFQSGVVARAPKWMQKSGLEWLHRLVSEPRRLWRRYFIIAPSFLLNVICEQIKLYFARVAPES
jgi:N-acetylglucosaminyldiphosphoundecaprenol N-acetyl-beta-D-mannosaminyltransferase